MLQYFVGAIKMLLGGDGDGVPRLMSLPRVLPTQIGEWHLHQQQQKKTLFQSVERAQQVLNKWIVVWSAHIHFLDLCIYACVTWHFNIVISNTPSQKALIKKLEIRVFGVPKFKHHHHHSSFRSYVIRIWSDSCWKYETCVRRMEASTT